MMVLLLIVYGMVVVMLLTLAWQFNIKLKKLRKNDKKLMKVIETVTEKWQSSVESIDKLEKFTNMMSSKLLSEMARIEREMQNTRLMAKKESVMGNTHHTYNSINLDMPEGISSPEEIAAQMLKIRGNKK